MSGILRFAGKNLNTTFHLRIGGVQTYQGRSDDRSRAVVPGRVGELITPNTKAIGEMGLVFPAWPDGLKNERREYDVARYFRGASSEFTSRAMAQLRSFLLSPYGEYKLLSDSYEPDFFRLATFEGAFAPERRGAGSNYVMRLVFSCDPRRFISGVPDVDIRSTRKYFSPEDSGITAYEVETIAYPMITVEGNDAEVTLQFWVSPSNDEYAKIVMPPFTGTAVIDTNDMRVTGSYTVTGGGRILSDVVGEPCLLPTGTTIHRSRGANLITVSPRWWVR